MIAVTLIRFRVDDPGTCTYAAVRSSEAVPLLADGFEFGDAETVSWDVLPGVEALAAANVGAAPPRAVAMLGTSVGTEWTSWHLPVPAPPVPS